MDDENVIARRDRAARALVAEDASARLGAVLAIGSDPDPVLATSLVERCAVEPDFYVRDMLSWALTRMPRQVVLPLLRRELDAEPNQARGQALHTLSKIADGRTWSWITAAMLCDPDDEVARTAWRAAVVLAPPDDASRTGLARVLVGQLGRGTVRCDGA